MKINKDEVTVFIPTLNESPTIGGLIREFRELGYSHIFVMDGHSTDATVAIAEQEGAEVRVQSGKGKGDAMMEGFRMVDTPYILLLDGDGTYAPADAELMLTPLFNGFDHVIGSRLIHAEEGAFSRLNLLGNYLLNHLFKFAHSRDLQDILSGYRAFSKTALQQMNLTETGFEIETEVSVEAVRNNQRIKVVPVTYRKRPGTDTKLNPLHDGYKIAVTIYRLAKMNNPIFYFGIIGAIMAIIGFLTGIVVVVEWLNGITHLPLAVLTVLLIMVGVEIFMFGVLSDMILAYHREMMNEIQRINPEIPLKE